MHGRSCELTDFQGLGGFRDSRAQGKHVRGSQPFSGFGLMEWTAEKARLAKWNGVGCVACRDKS